jgi:hypothetical protein
MKLTIPDKKIGLIRYYFFWKYYKQLNKILNIGIENCDYINLDITPQNKENTIDLITIAFNNTHVLKHQIKKIKKNITDKNYTHIIADNSSNLVCRDEIKRICRDEGVAYISIPINQKIINRLDSFAHSAALNWTYYQLVLKRRPRWFGFLDHDIYPLCPYRIEDKISNQPFYGRKIVTHSYWYLWAGFLFFELAPVETLHVDFSPAKINKTNLDTGGALYASLYHKENPENYAFAQNIRFGLNLIGYNFADEVDFIDNCWFHSTNASAWRSMSDYNFIINDIVNNEKIYLLEQKD